MLELPVGGRRRNLLRYDDEKKVRHNGSASMRQRAAQQGTSRSHVWIAISRRTCETLFGVSFACGGKCERALFHIPHVSPVRAMMKPEMAHLGVSLHGHNLPAVDALRLRRAVGPQLRESQAVHTPAAAATGVRTAAATHYMTSALMWKVSCRQDASRAPSPRPQQMSSLRPAAGGSESAPVATTLSRVPGEAV